MGLPYSVLRHGFQSGKLREHIIGELCNTQIVVCIVLLGSPTKKRIHIAPGDQVPWLKSGLEEKMDYWFWHSRLWTCSSHILVAQALIAQVFCQELLNRGHDPHNAAYILQQSDLSSVSLSSKYGHDANDENKQSQTLNMNLIPSKYHALTACKPFDTNC